MFNREFLRGLGIEEEQVNAIMSRHGSTIGPKEDEITQLKSEKQRLEGEIQTLKDNGDEDLKEQIAALEGEKQQLEQQLADQAKQHKLETYVNSLGVKDPAYIMDKLSDVELKDDEFVGIDERVNELKEKHPLLFEAEESTEPPKPAKWSQGGVSTTGGNTLTREQIMKEPDRQKRQQLIRENRDLF